MKKSGSLLFPFAEDNLTGGLKRAETVGSVISSAIKCFILTEPGQRRGNPIGSFIPSLRHRLIPSDAILGLQDELKKELTNQFPGVTFLEVLMNQTLEDRVVTLEIRITFGTPVSELEQLTIIL